MRRFAAKLAFVHRTLWQRDPAYRWAVLLGPAPACGALVAALALAAAHPKAPGTAGQDSGVPWAHWTRPVPLEGQPFAEAPAAPLPRTDASGRYVGLQPGWLGSIQPMTVDASMDPDVSPAVLTTFTLDQPTIPLARVLDAGPPSGLFAGIGKTFFVVQAPGVYAFSVRLARSGAQSANCLVRFGSAKHRMVRSLTVHASVGAVLNYPPTEFRLLPGLFPLEVAAGCWRDDRMVGPGELTVMVRHPGETALQPTAADELMRPASRQPDHGGAQPVR